MVKIFFISLVMFIFIILDWVPMVKQQKWKELFFYTAMMLAVFVLGILLGLEANILSPSEPLEKLISAIWGLN